MPQVFDDVVSGNGSAPISAASVQWFLVHTVNAGPDVFVSDLNNADNVIKLGWIALGAQSDNIDFISRIYWSAPIWITFLEFEWHPLPTNQAGNPPDFGVWADHIRWALSPETEIQLFVWGQ